jgi:hypothetical protein
VKNKAFETIIESFNTQLNALNSNGYALYDADNPEYFISGIKYSKENKQIEFQTVLDPSRKEE